MPNRLQSDAILPWLPLERVTTGSDAWRNFAITCSTFDPDCSAAEPGSIEMFDKDFELLSIVSNFGSVRLIRVANMARAAIIQNRVSKSVSTF